MRDASPSPAQSPHSLAFRVMRLTTPLPSTTNTLPFQAQDIDNVKNPPTWQAEGAPCAVGSLSVLPSSFGSIYASETFRSFISVCNRSQQTVPQVSLTISMQTPTQRRIPLFESQAPKILAQRATINQVVEVPLPEVGVHVLICVANYRDSSSASRTLKQYFRFNVLIPLEPQIVVRPVSTGLEALPQSTLPSHHCQQYLVHIRILNSLPVTVYDTKATFAPQALFHVSPLQAAGKSFISNEANGESQCEDARQVSMGPSDTQNFIFHIYRSTSAHDKQTPSDPLLSNDDSRHIESDLQIDHPLQTTPATEDELSSGSNAYDAKPLVDQPPQLQLGQIVISWRSALGEHGSLTRSVTVFQPIEAQHDIDVSIQATPQTIQTHHPFVARCAVRNNKTHPVRLYLQVRRDLVGEIVPMGVSGVSLGEVQPGRTAWCAITLIPLLKGQHTISGIRVVDIDSQQTYKADAPTIFVS